MNPSPPSPPRSPGRPKGRRNSVTREAREFARSILDSEDYRSSLVLRARTASLPPAIEVALWHYAFGKPKEVVEVRESMFDYTRASTQELRDRTAFLLSELRRIEMDAESDRTRLDQTDNESAKPESDEATVH